MRQRKGFTIIEALVVITITGILLGVLLANYRRSNENSLLIRETASIMSRIRLAQETAASAQTYGTFCENALHTECVDDGTCAPLAGVPKKCIAKPPPGGEALWFSCNSEDHYRWMGDTNKCTGDCFVTPDGTVENEADNLITLNGNWPDFEREKFYFDLKIELKDIQLTRNTAGVLSPFRCNSGTQPTGGAPWKGQSLATPPNPTNSAVPNTWPLEVMVQFTTDPGDQLSANVGRKVNLSDNVSLFPPGGGVWEKAELMIGLTNRNTDCRVITMTNTNVLTDTVDANCAF